MAAFNVLLGLFATAFILGDVSGTACPYFWESFEGNCYQPMYDEKLTYAEAKAYCELEVKGAHLVVPRTADQQAFLTTTMLQSEHLGGSIWIGCDDTKKEGKFKCADGNLPTGHKMWTNKEPDNGQLECDPVEQDCAILRYNGLWWDNECDNKAYFICQVKAS